jgi:sn-glycerol 3-phosphate transport system permease protein
MVGRNKVSLTFMWLLALLVALVIFLPIWYLSVMSFTPTKFILQNNISLIPRYFSIDNFITVSNDNPLFRWLFNTFFVSAVTVAIQIVTSSLAAYAFAFLNFKGKNIIFLFILATMMVPDEAVIISNYLTMSHWGWLDTYQVLIVPFMGSAMGIFLLRQFYMTFAKELHEAAELDGCTNLNFLFKIVLPLSKGMIGAFAIVSFLSCYNRYLWPLLVTNKTSMRVVQVGITSLQDQDAPQTIGLALAAVFLVSLPTFIIFVAGHKQLVKGLMAGAVKG